MSKKGRAIRVGECDLDEPETLLNACFQIDSSVELKEVPTTGEEYLLKVKTERQRYRVITKCDEDLTKFAKNQSLFAQELAPAISAPDSLKPTIEWQNIQVADFSDVRMYITRLLAKKRTWPISVTKHEFKYKDCTVWKEFFETNMPTLSCVFGLNQSLLDPGLDILVKSLNNVKKGNTLNQKTGRWLYAFLACLQLPLLSDTISILRELARKCAEIRSNVNIEEDNASELAAPLNVFICLVSRYFRQYDLAD